jgi:hypothetical protein
MPAAGDSARRSARSVDRGVSAEHRLLLRLGAPLQLGVLGVVLDPGCLLQMRAGALARGMPVAVEHPIDLLARAHRV